LLDRTVMAKKNPTKKPLKTAVPIPEPIKRKDMYEDAVSGRIVNEKYAAEHPDTTIKRKVPVNPPKKS
jgi:hypothetical protein